MITPRTTWLPMLVLAVGLGVTVLFLYQVREFRILREAVSDDSLTQSVAARIEAHVATRLDVASTLVRRWQSGGITTERAFAEETEAIHAYFPDFQAINWADEARVIRWVTPRSGNEAAVNLDLNALPLPRQALDVADQIGAASLTPPIELAQGGRGMVAYIPLSRATVQDGYLNIVFRIAPLLNGALRDSMPAGYEMIVRDGDATVHASAGLRAPTEDMVSLQRDITVGNRTWSVALVRERRVGLEPGETAIFGAGALISLVLAFLVWRLLQDQGARRNSEARFSDFAHISSDWFWETDDTHRFTYLSDGYERTTGTRPEALLGRTRAEVGAPGASQESLTSLIACMNAHEPFQDFRHYRDHPNGRRIHLSISGVPVLDPQGRFQGYRGVGRDITTVIEAEMRLTRALVEAQAANASKSAFIATMSHELRTPLNAIIGFGEILRDGHPMARSPQKLQEYSGHICDSAQYLLNLINDILSLSQAEGGQRTLEIAALDTAKVLNDAVSKLRIDARAKGLRIEVSVAEGAEVLAADHRSMLQILLNLIGNALKFTPAGGAITVHASPVEDGVAIAVRDTGQGIPEALLARVTEPFVTSDDGVGTHYNQRGTGLGLSIVRSLIDLHGGTLTITSRVGQGTEVVSVFPRPAARDA